jgi:nucleoside phosphorylase
MPLASLPNEDYTVGWICALPLEAASATAMLDEIHEKPRKRLSNDHNVYTLGCIGEHNIVIACLPAGVYGTNPAAMVATQMLSSFESITFGLMVGIGGGVPSAERDIRLGDVVVSKPGGTFGGVVQYDRGKIAEGKFERTGLLNKPPQVLLSAVSAMEKRHMMGDNKISDFLADMLRKYPKMKEKFSYQSTQHDPLHATYGGHLGDDNTSELRPVKRLRCRSPDDPVVHYGLIASGNQVIKDAATRDQLRDELGGDVLCFEMEAAGLMDTFPCIVIRGICDYADYRKNNLWQGYAAATAAACAKELLSIIQINRVAVTLLQLTDSLYRGQCASKRHLNGTQSLLAEKMVLRRLTDDLKFKGALRLAALVEWVEFTWGYGLISYLQVRQGILYQKYIACFGLRPSQKGRDSLS